MNAAPLVKQVRAKYAAVAASGLSGLPARTRSVAEAFGPGVGVTPKPTQRITTD